MRSFGYWILVCLRLATGSSTAAAQDVPIVDGRSGEWTATDPLYSDAQGDGAGAVDFGRIWVRNDDRFVYFSFETTGTVSLQSDSDITLRLDADDDASTGIPGCGIGAELVWEFSERIGSFTYEGTTLSIAFQDIGLVSAPTVTSAVFEASLELDAEPRRLGPLFPTDTVAVCLTHGNTGDRLPDEGERLTFNIDRNAVGTPVDIDLARKPTSALRLLSWNVEQDGLFEANRTNAIGRILNFVEPDVIVFSEIFGHTAGQTVERLNELAPGQAGSEWFAASAPSSVVLASRTPITGSMTVDQNGRARGFFVDGPDEFDGDIFIVGAHLYCCEADDRRQSQVDQIMAAIRDAQTEGRIAAQTPIILAGDMNFVGDHRQPQTLIEGSIVSAAFGPPFDPDWDQTAFADAVPLTTGLPQTFTWSNPSAPNNRQFSPGRLDYVIYSDAVLTQEQSFALYTPAIPFADLQRLGLLGSDTGATSDHLPVVVDFAPRNATASESDGPLPAQVDRLEVFPNPASDRIHVSLPGLTPDARVTVTLYDVTGRLLSASDVPSSIRSARSFRLDIPRLPPGLYIVSMSAGDAVLWGNFVKVSATN